MEAAAGRVGSAGSVGSNLRIVGVAAPPAGVEDLPHKLVGLVRHLGQVCRSRGSLCRLGTRAGRQERERGNGTTLFMFVRQCPPYFSLFIAATLHVHWGCYR